MASRYAPMAPVDVALFMEQFAQVVVESGILRLTESFLEFGEGVFRVPAVGQDDPSPLCAFANLGRVG